MNKLFKSWIICSKTFFSDSTGCRRRKYSYHEKSKPDRIRYKKCFQIDTFKSTIRPPFKIYFESMTVEVGEFDQFNHKDLKRRYIDARYYNMYIIMPKMVYLLSSTLMKAALHKQPGQQYQMDIINFILIFGYGTRSGPFLTLHGAYTKYTNLTNMRYINNCDDKDRIIPVTIFLVMLFNACCTYQKGTTRLMLITALDPLDLGTTLDDETFMNTLSKCKNLNKLS
jgi:hypothetical protein